MDCPRLSIALLAVLLTSGAVTAEDKKPAPPKKTFENKQKTLEGQDRMGNFEIQPLMSNYNQADSIKRKTPQNSSKGQAGGSGGSRQRR
jgi:hypothetical protein